jgi:ketosteroid isomerase-like protein
MPDANLKIYERMIEAFNREGPAGPLPFFAADAEVYDPDAPEGRPYRGRDAIARFLGELVDGSDVEIRDWRLLPAGDRVVGLVHTHRSRDEDGAEVGIIEAHTLTFRDGEVAYWRAYLDPKEALADAGLDLSLLEMPASGDADTGEHELGEPEPA